MSNFYQSYYCQSNYHQSNNDQRNNDQRNYYLTNFCKSIFQKSKTLSEQIIHHSNNYQSIYTRPTDTRAMQVPPEQLLGNTKSVKYNFKEVCVASQGPYPAGSRKDRCPEGAALFPPNCEAANARPHRGGGRRRLYSRRWQPPAGPTAQGPSRPARSRSADPPQQICTLHICFRSIYTCVYSS